MAARSTLRFFTPLMLVAAHLVAGSASAEVFISEYIEGSSNNKAIEIFNPSGAPVNLGTGGYQLLYYMNAATSATVTINLTGTVAAGDVYVIAQSSANATILAQADQTNGDGWYNGDDAIELRHGAAVIDSIGKVGEQIEWGSGNTSTTNNTLRRKPSVCVGDSNSGDAFDPGTEWDGFANDDATDLGSHTSGCSGGEVAPAVFSTTPANAATGVAVGANVTIRFSEPVDVEGSWFQITCTSSGGHSAAFTDDGTNFTINPDIDFTSGDVCTVTVFAINVTDVDAEDPPDEMAANYQFSFTVGGGGGPGPGALPPVINEVVAAHAGADSEELVEVWGSISASYAGWTVLLLDGDGAPGTVLAAWPVGTTNGSGVWTTPDLATGTIPDAAVTVLLVDGFIGVVGQDLDTNDDGTFETPPWTTLRDSVAISYGAPGEVAYSPVVLPPGFAGDATPVGGASRIPQGVDTNSTSDWTRNDFDGEGLPGFPAGTLGQGEARNTPGATNRGRLEDYWQGIEATSQAALRAAIHGRIDDSQRLAYSSSDADTWEILEAADENPADPAEIIDVYLNEDYVKFGGGTGPYNREHTWPQSAGFPDDAVDNYPRSDCHHLFLSEVGYNADRGSRPFGNCNAGCTRLPTVANNGFGGVSGPYPSDSNWVTGSDGSSGTFEVWSHRKGDVARAILYLDVRYEGGIHGATSYAEPDLVVTDSRALIASTQNTDQNEPLAYMGLRADLLAWHAADPPDAAELARNNAVWRYQGNRNPFIDHPEWVACVYDGQCQPTLLMSGFEEFPNPSPWVGWTP